MLKYAKSKIIRGTLAMALISAMFIIGLPLNTKAASPGALDPTFGTGGKVSHDVLGSGINDDVNGVAVQADGKIVVVGGFNGGPAATNNFCVARYNANGALDTTFDTDGIVTTDFSAQTDKAYAVAIQPDGKIVVVGSTRPFVGGTESTAVARYKPNGALDPTFDTDGKVIVDVAVGIIDLAYAVAIQEDGKIVTAGYADMGGGQDFALLRFNLDGTLNTGFSGDGIVTTDFGGGSDQAAAIVVQPNGKIVAAGTGGIDFAVARYNVNGALDLTFDTDGKVTTAFGGNSQISGLAIQVDNKLVAVGYATSGTTDFAAARYNTNGSLDITFDADGKLTTNVSPGANDIALDVSIQSDGKILAAGASSESFAVTRYNADGSLDNSFGNSGIVITNIADGIEAGKACAIYGDKLVVAGDSVNGGDFAVVRYNLLVAPTAGTDFDGDGFPDYVIFRPGTGTWYILRSSDNTTQNFLFGLNTDVPLDGDFDGDGKSDLATFSPSNGIWAFKSSSTGALFTAIHGQNGDKPVPGDVDKDGKTDFVYFRPSTLDWSVLKSSDGFASSITFQFGAAGDIPVGAAIYP